MYPHFQLILKVSVRKTYIREYNKVLPGEHILVLAEEVGPLTIPSLMKLLKRTRSLLHQPGSTILCKDHQWLGENPLYTTKFQHGTCKQSRDVLTTRGDLDWQASSNGRKYLSASMKFAFGGAAAPSLGKKQKRAREGK